jgi:hypothetical protein
LAVVVFLEDAELLGQTDEVLDLGQAVIVLGLVVEDVVFYGAVFQIWNLRTPPKLSTSRKYAMEYVHMPEQHPKKRGFATAISPQHNHPIAGLELNLKGYGDLDMYTLLGPPRGIPKRPPRLILINIMQLPRTTQIPFLLALLKLLHSFVLAHRSL